LTKELGRIAKLKDSIDTLTYMTNAIEIIREETGISWDASPDRAIRKATEKLAELKKK
jgi:hypothetical protein